MAISKTLLGLAVALFLAAWVSAQAEPICYPPGFPCKSNDQCCGTLTCNPWAGRCTKDSGLPPGLDCTPAGALCSEDRACCAGLICSAQGITTKRRCITPAIPTFEMNDLE
ncbi:hypothetical protein QAD02_019923 [Eretmocerus hayati]|uniref:Uncharacterized protein n=1 Tax=Eretmocerus hayati TaxID=131215 RepID=A0ACC2PMU9_9HYME|nr:hypothetical protein QAD02_019923 [Eretmocerus hayati]